MSFHRNLCIALTLIACREPLVFDTPIPDDGTFERADPTPEQAERFAAAAEYSADHAGRGMMVLAGQNVVFEAEQNGHQASEPTHIFSGTKTFSCAAILLAQAENIGTTDELVADSLRDWQGDDEKSAITVDHLLHFTSGLEDDFWRLTYDALWTEQYVDDKYQVAMDQPVKTTPGSTYEYGSVHLMVFGEWLTQKSGEDPLSFLDSRLFEPLSFQYAGWNTDPAGNPALPYGAWTTTNEWAKFGVLLRDDGAWQGQQLLESGALAQCFTGSAQMPAYGLGVWLNAELTADQAELFPTPGIEAGRVFPSAPADMVVAAGANDNRLYVIPSHDLVVVRMGNGDSKWKDDDFLARLLE